MNPFSEIKVKVRNTKIEEIEGKSITFTPIEQVDGIHPDEQRCGEINVTEPIDEKTCEDFAEKMYTIL
jgi:hypothetical protein